MFYFTEKGIPKSNWMEENTLYEITDLIIKDIKEKAKQQLIDGQTAAIPVMMLSEEGAKQVQKQSEELLKIIGIDTKKERENTLENYKALLESFK